MEATQIEDKAIVVQISNVDDLKGENGAFAYTAQEEGKYVRKLDFWIMPLLIFTYAIQYSDKAVLGSAAIFGLNSDLGLTKVIGTNSLGQPITDNTKYSDVNVIFYVGYALGSYPMAMLADRFPTAKVCSIAIFFWSIIVLTTPACTGFAGIMVNRFFLGVCEASVAPVFTVFVSFWYTRSEQAFRNGLWYAGTGPGQIFAPLINYGLGYVSGGLSPWKYMFFVWGGISILWSACIYFLLPDDPVSTKSRFLNEKEKYIAYKRLEANRAGTVYNSIDRKQIYEALTSFNFWSCLIIMACTCVPGGAQASFNPLVINAFGFSKFDSLLLGVPSGFLSMCFILGATYLCRITHNKRYTILCCMLLITFAGNMICWLGPRNNRGILFFGVLLGTAITSSSAVIVGISSSNVAGHTKKFTQGAGTFIGYCIGDIVSQFVFASTPGPDFVGGFSASVAFSALGIVLSILSIFYLKRENARRDREYGEPGEASFDVEMDMTDKYNKNFRYIY